MALAVIRLSCCHPFEHVADLQGRLSLAANRLGKPLRPIWDLCNPMSHIRSGLIGQNKCNLQLLPTKKVFDKKRLKWEDGVGEKTMSGQQNGQVAPSSATTSAGVRCRHTATKGSGDRRRSSQANTSESRGFGEGVPRIHTEPPTKQGVARPFLRDLWVELKWKRRNLGVAAIPRRACWTCAIQLD